MPIIITIIILWEKGQGVLKTEPFRNIFDFSLRKFLTFWFWVLVKEFKCVYSNFIDLELDFNY